MGAPLQALQQTGEDNQAQIAQAAQGGTVGGGAAAGGTAAAQGQADGAAGGGAGAGGRKQATFEDLVDKVVNPANNTLGLDFAKIMAQLINDDPKSGYEFVEKD